MDLIVNKIKNLIHSKQINHLDTSSNVLQDLVNSVNSIDYLKYVSYTDQKYNRISLYKDHHIEILLLCWKENQSTSYHYHNNICIFTILRGCLKETVIIDNDYTTNHYESSDIKIINEKNYYHKVESLKESISFHIYIDNIDF